jgi:hypothetical protein
VAGPVIQATGRSEFEDGLGSGDFVSGYSYHMSVALGCLTIRSRPNSKANGLKIRHGPFFENFEKFETISKIFLSEDVSVSNGVLILK